MPGHVNRIEPRVPAHLMTTYQISSPIETHTRVAICAEVECPSWAHGFQSTVDVGTDLGAQQANYIRLHSGRHFTYVENRTLVTFTFPPGQKCFREHRVPLGRPELYVVRNGDHRGNRTGWSRSFGAGDRAARDWVDDFGEHQLKIKEATDRG